MTEWRLCKLERCLRIPKINLLGEVQRRGRRVYGFDFRMTPRDTVDDVYYSVNFTCSYLYPRSESIDGKIKKFSRRLRVTCAIVVWKLWDGRRRRRQRRHNTYIFFLIPISCRDFFSPQRSLTQDVFWQREDKNTKFIIKLRPRRHGPCEGLRTKKT